MDDFHKFLSCVRALVDALTKTLELAVQLLIPMDRIVRHIVMARAEPHNKAVTLRCLPAAALVHMMPMQVTRCMAEEAFLRISLENGLHRHASLRDASSAGVIVSMPSERQSSTTASMSRDICAVS